MDEIAEVTSYCALFGVAAGGLREWRNTADLITEEQIVQEELKIRERYKDRTFSTPKSKRMLRYHASKEAHGLRMLRVCTSASRWCVSFGAIAAAYVTLEQGMGVLRGEDDVWNAVAAGSVSGNLLGLCIPGTASARLRGAIVGGIAGGLLSLPFAYARILSNSLESLQNDSQKHEGGVPEDQTALQAPPSPSVEATETKPVKVGPFGRLMKRIRGN